MISLSCRLRIWISCCLLALGLTARGAAPPNFIFILVDDLGLTDVGCFGNTFVETPNIDRLAHDGLKFTQAYSACTVCSPTRASLLTGKSPAALRLTDWIPGHVKPTAKLRVPDWTKQLRTTEATLPSLLKAKGYATASIGKWHLGPAAPTAHGFGVNIAGTEKGQPPTYFSPYQIPNLPDGPRGEFLTDRLTDEALSFISAQREKPFFLYLSHFAVHQPIAGKPAVVAKYRAKAESTSAGDNAVYAALIESVDDSVGRIRSRLEELGLAENTVIVFTSDNGGLLPVTQNYGLRAGKGSAYEGGVRVPLIYFWPGTVVKGGVCSAPTITADHFYTMLELAGAPAIGATEFRSLAGTLLGKGDPEPRNLHWHYPHYHPGGATPYSAIRSGDFKLIAFFEDWHVELYNLKTDPREKTNLAQSLPEKTAELRQKLAAWWLEVRAQMPTENPDFDPAKAAGGAK